MFNSSTVVNFLFGSLVITKRVLWNRVCPSFCPAFDLSVWFLGIGSLIFSETYHGVRGPYISGWNWSRFFKANCRRAKMTKNGPKWPQNMVFGLFKKMVSWVLSGIAVKREFLWFINIRWRLNAWQKSCLQVIVENVSWPMRFQYSLINNISLIDHHLTLIFGM